MATVAALSKQRSWDEEKMTINIELDGAGKVMMASPQRQWRGDEVMQIARFAGHELMAITDIDARVFLDANDHTLNNTPGSMQMNIDPTDNDQQTEPMAEPFHLDGCYVGVMGCEPGRLEIKRIGGAWVSGENGQFYTVGARISCKQVARVRVTSPDDSNLEFYPDPGQCEQVGLPVQGCEKVGDDAQQLAAAVSMLMKVKNSLMHQRRFGQDTLQGYRTACTSVEGDIEQWLIDNGHLPSGA